MMSAFALWVALGLSAPAELATPADFAGSPHFLSPEVKAWARAALIVRPGVDGVPNDASLLVPHLASLTVYESNAWVQFTSWVVRFIEERGVPVTRATAAPKAEIKIAAKAPPSTTFDVPLAAALRFSELARLAAHEPRWGVFLADICRHIDALSVDPYRAQSRRVCGKGPKAPHSGR